MGDLAVSTRSIFERLAIIRKRYMCPARVEAVEGPGGRDREILGGFHRPATSQRKRTVSWNIWP